LLTGLLEEDAQPRSAAATLLAATLLPAAGISRLSAIGTRTIGARPILASRLVTRLGGLLAVGRQSPLRWTFGSNTLLLLWLHGPSLSAAVWILSRSPLLGRQLCHCQRDPHDGDAADQNQSAA
jgi:hypothetical protein